MVVSAFKSCRRALLEGLARSNIRVCEQTRARPEPVDDRDADLSGRKHAGYMDITGPLHASHCISCAVRGLY